MKFKFDGIHIDLVYCWFRLPTIPKRFDIFDNNNLKYLDEQSVLSLNG